MSTTIKTQETAGGAAWGKTGTRAHCQWEWKNGAAAVKSVAVPQKLKIELTQDPAVPFLYLPKRTRSTFSKAAIFIPALTAPSFLQPQRGKQSKEPSTNEGGSQMQAHTYNGILFCLKKDKF